MHYRRLGKTDIEISEVGYGAWGIGGTGWVGADDDKSVAALNRAFDLGVNFVDTALVYGNGHSERIVGSVIGQRSEDINVATKVPPENGEWPAPPNIHPDDAFPAKHIIECTERSLRNLGVEAIDLQQLHAWHDEWVGRGSWLDGVERLKRDGKIRFFGVSLNRHQPSNALKLIESGVVETVQVIYNVFDQSPEDELFAACERGNVGVIIRVPFDEGGLTGRIKPDTEFPEGDFRNDYFRGNRKAEVHERVGRILSDLGATEKDMAEIALRFTLSSPAVSTVIPGMRTVRNVERNCAVADGRGLPAAWLAKLKAHRWVREFES